MAIKSSGPLSVQEIANEFGGAVPHSLSEYYRGGPLVPNTATNSTISLSGAISIGQFYNTANQAPPGQVEFTTPGTFNWTVPEGVFSVSVVCIGAGGSVRVSDRDGGSGGGALRYKNSIPVTPGTVIPIRVGAQGQSSIFNIPSPLCSAAAGSIANATTGGAGGSTGVGDGGGDGGRGSNGEAFPARLGAGGGAGGYTTNGGNGSGNNRVLGGGGGGVGLFGGAEGGAGGSGSNPGAGGSGGASGSGAIGGLFGGGSGAWDRQSSSGTGAVRVIWPGDERVFPTTRTGNE